MNYQYHCLTFARIFIYANVRGGMELRAKAAATGPMLQFGSLNQIWHLPKALKSSNTQ
jgi:hypothetical protein